jgi:ornithine decarboxylase
MNFVQRFTFLFSAPTFEAEDLEGMRVAEIIAAIQRMGFQVIRAPRIEDAEIAVQTDAAIGCLVVDWGKKGLEGKAASLINLMRRRGLEMPIVLLVRRKRFEDVPVEVLDFIDGYVFLAEETPEFIARNLVSRLTQYAETLKTPFFGALVDYAEQGNQLWTCPGHNGGIFYSRSPIGRIFMEHLGEAIFRDDLDNSITELGDLLTHEGPALAAQKEAAAIDEAKIREAIRSNPLVTDKDAWQRQRPFRAAVIEQCTYDGTIYSAQEILARIGHLCDYILFDEAGPAS